MNESQVRIKVATMADKLTELGVKSLSLFGSAAFNNAKEDSYLDFRVEFEGMATFDRFMG